MSSMSTSPVHGDVRRITTGGDPMEEQVIVDTSFSAIINAPLERIDIPAWCFSLPDDEYQGCSPAHFAAGTTTARDGRRMSINVEVLGGVPMVLHYVEQVAESNTWFSTPF